MAKDRLRSAVEDDLVRDWTVRRLIEDGYDVSVAQSANGLSQRIAPLKPDVVQPPWPSYCRQAAASRAEPVTCGASRAQARSRRAAGTIFEIKIYSPSYELTY
jgi:hypothetical protein